MTAKEEPQGITTISQKADSICPYYQRPHSLFGKRENIKPSVIAEAWTSSRSEDFFTAPESQIFDYGSLGSALQSDPAPDPASQVYQFNNPILNQDHIADSELDLFCQEHEEDSPEVLASGNVAAVQGEHLNPSEPSSPTDLQLAQFEDNDDDCRSAADTSPAGRGINGQRREITPATRRRQTKR